MHAKLQLKIFSVIIGVKNTLLLLAHLALTLTAGSLLPAQGFGFD